MRIHKLCEDCGKKFVSYSAAQYSRCPECRKIARANNIDTSCKVPKIDVRFCRECGIKFYAHSSSPNVVHCEWHRVSIKHKIGRAICSYCGKKYSGVITKEAICPQCKHDKMEKKFLKYIANKDNKIQLSQKNIDYLVPMCYDTGYVKVKDGIVDIADLVANGSLQQTFTLDELNICLDNLRRATK